MGGATPPQGYGGRQEGRTGAWKMSERLSSEHPSTFPLVLPFFRESRALRPG